MRIFLQFLITLRFAISFDY